jgi:5-methylthioadenosine/S-adenosylhomocysteine deaminase
MSDILIENGLILTINREQEIIDRGYLLIDGDSISTIAAGNPPEEVRAKAKEILDASDALVMPGMVNAHIHFGDAFIRGMDDNRPLLGWLEEAAFPIYRHLTAADARIAALMGAVENVRGGATAVIDNVYIPKHSGGFDASFEAAVETGIRYKLVRGFVECGYPQEDLWEDFDTVIGEVKRLHSAWHGKENGRLRLDFGPNVHWGIKGENIIRAAELAAELGIGIHTHTAESEDELELTLEPYGMRHLEWFASLGVLGPNFQLAHCVWIDDREIEQIAASGAVAVHNPASNALLSTGVAPILKLRAAGAHVALGTDGQAVNIGQEMLDVLKWALNLHKISSRDPHCLTPEDVLHMACQEGAYAFGQPEQIGSLEVGKRADVVIVDMNNPRLAMPSLSVPSLLVNFARSTDVDTVIVDGQILLKDKKILFIDEDALLQEFKAVRKDLLNRAGVISA